MTTGEYPVYLRGERAGTVRISNEGIRYIVDAFCPHADGLVRLSLYGGGGEGYLGVMQPENGGLCNMLRLVEQLDEASRQEIAAAAQERIDSIYNWQLTADWTRCVFDYLTYEEEARAGEELPTLL